MTKKIPFVATCQCGHSGMWHKPECRIRNCDCTEFMHGVIRSSADGDWMKAGVPVRSKAKKATE